MTDKKITQLTAGTPVATDVIPYVSSPGGVPETKKALVSNFAPLTTKGDVYTFGSVNDRLAVGSNGQMILASSTATTGLVWASRPFAVNVILGNGITALPSGTLMGWVEMPFGGSLTQYHIVANAAGNATLDVYKSAYADIPFGTSDTICGANYPAIAGTQVKYDGTLSNWTKTFSAGDWLGVYVSTAATVLQCTLSLRGVITDAA